MALRTARRSNPYLFGDTTGGVTLTAAFSGNEISFPTEMYTGMTMYIEYTPAENGVSLNIQTEGGPEVSDFYPDSNERDQGDGATDILRWRGDVAGLVKDTAYKRKYRVPMDSSFTRISVKELGVVSDYGVITIKGEFRIPR